MSERDDDRTVGPVLFSRERIATRIDAMASEIDADYHDRGPLLVVGVQKGAAFFVADLVRRVTVPLMLTYVDVSSYGARAFVSEGPRLSRDTDLSPAGHHVLIVEDLIDTGRTLALLEETLRSAGAASVATAVLLDLKGRAANRPIEPRYRGFETDARWVCGFGIDYRELYRNLPDIHAVGPTAV